MSSEQLTRLRGIRTAFIGLLCVVALTSVGNASPIDIEIRVPRTKLDPLDILHFTYYGSGVVINQDTVLTAFHNIESPVGTWPTGVKVLAYAPKKDVCVIKYPTAGRKFSRLAPNQPKVGDHVYLVGRWGTYSGTWANNPHYEDQMSVKFDGKRPKIGDSGGGVYSDTGLVGIFLGFSGWTDGPKGEYSRVASWTTLKAFGIPISTQPAPVKPETDELLPLPGTEDGKAPTKGRDSTKEEVPAEITAKEPEKEVNHGTRRTPRGSTEADNEDGHEKPTDRQPEGRGSSGINDPGQRPGHRDEESGHLETGTASESNADKGASLPSPPPIKGRGSSSMADDMLEMLITAALGAAGIAATGGTGTAIWFGVKGIAALHRRRKKRKSDTGINTLADQIEEVLGRKSAADGFRTPHIPGRNVDEIGELLQLAELEGYDPLMGSTFGLFMQDEINQLLSRPEISGEQKDIVRKLYNSTMDRLNSAAPLVKGQ